MVPSVGPESVRPINILENNTNPRSELLKLQEHVQEGRFDTLVDSLMGTATEMKEVPTTKIDAFVNTLTLTERSSLERALEGAPADPRATALRERMKALQVTESPSAPHALAEGPEGMSEPARKVISALDKGIARLTGGGKLNEIAAKIGYKGEIGPQQLDFVKNFFLGYAAKLFEGITTSLRQINPTVDLTKILNLPLELRLLNIKDPAQKAAYKAAYLKRAKESTGVFIAPTLEEALNPQAATPIAAPNIAPSPVLGEKVEAAKRTVKLTDSTTFDIERSSDKKTIVTVASNKADMKVIGGETLDVYALDAKDSIKAAITLKLVDNRSITIDAETLRNAVQSKKTAEKKEITASDGSTKIELI